MEARELKLVPGAGGHREWAGRSRAIPLALGLFVLGTALAATWLGADRARQKIEVRQLAEEALQTALERGREDPEVHAALLDLRRTLGWRPLDSKTRVVYASLVLGLASQLEEMRLAAFHAERAAELAPVTVPVVRAAALVLASTGDLDRALVLLRRMFGYDPANAAETLAQIESLVLGVRIDECIPGHPDAWTAWSRQLSKDGRRAEAGEWLRRTHERWPAHLPAWVGMANAAFGRRDWPELESLLSPDRPLPLEPEAAPLHVWQAHLALRRGQRNEALSGAETALRLRGQGWVRTLAGDLFESAGDWERARSEWSGALHDTPRDRIPARSALLVRLARLEDRHGRPGAALRLWNSVLEIDPDHREARRRVDDLSGFQR